MYKKRRERGVLIDIRKADWIRRERREGGREGEREKEEGGLEEGKVRGRKGMAHGRREEEEKMHSDIAFND